MNQAQNYLAGKSGAWREYRRAFEEFAKRVRQVQNLTAQPQADRAAIDAALREADRARAVYSQTRDVLAQCLEGKECLPQESLRRSTAA